MSTRISFTTADLAALPDRLDDTRYELTDGGLLIAHQPAWDHQFVSGTVASALEVWSRNTRRGQANIAPGMIFSPEDCVAPDVVWISRERRARALRDGTLYAAPELIDRSPFVGANQRAADKELKPKLYAREQVEEYWLVDWRTHTIAVYRRDGEALVLVATLTDGDRLTSPLLPGFAQPIVDLWQPPFD